MLNLYLKYLAMNEYFGWKFITIGQIQPCHLGPDHFLFKPKKFFQQIFLLLFSSAC